MATILKKVNDQFGPKDMPVSTLVGQRPSGMLDTGNIDLNTRPTVRNDDGSISTVRSMSYSREKGVETLIPTVSNEGTILGQDDAIKYWEAKGQHLGKFRTPEDADKYGKKLSRAQSKQYGAK
jgi:hypothetical protein